MLIKHFFENTGNGGFNGPLCFFFLVVQRDERNHRRGVADSIKLFRPGVQDGAAIQ